MSLPGDNDPFIEAHQLAAKVAFGASLLTGSVSLVTLIACRGGNTLSGRLTRIALLLLLVTTAMMGYVANFGGKIRHTEIRAGGLEEETKK